MRSCISVWISQSARPGPVPMDITSLRVSVDGSMYSSEPSKYQVSE